MDFDILATMISLHQHLIGTPTTVPLLRTPDVPDEARLSLLILNFHQLKERASGFVIFRVRIIGGFKTGFQPG